MTFRRSGGLLLHPTSLPGPGGIGTLGPNAYAFVDMMARARLGLWQVLPLNPTGYADSPYAALSAFAGNPMLIAVEPLIEAGWLQPGDDERMVCGSPLSVDYGSVVPAKFALLRKAFTAFLSHDLHTAEFNQFRETARTWLDEFCLFMALKDAYNGAPWEDWEDALRLRLPAALADARRRLRDEIEFHRFAQFIFHRQWTALRRYANARRIRIIGDIPIFVAYDSADVWANQDLFQLDAEGRPEIVAGVPPDYFSRTGQLWGNPHYRWDVLARRNFDWWVDRFRTLLRLVDIVRLDHFRGFAAAWAVPYGSATAEHGEWVPAQGEALFRTLRERLGELPIIAEDLGVITPDVDALRLEFGFPGMKILQFAFGTGADNPSLPHNFTPDTVVYTGTHDNDTTVGWYVSIEDGEREYVRHYLSTNGTDISWDLMRLAFASVSNFALVPLQDVLRLGTWARMNMPGSTGGNWKWRYQSEEITPLHVAYIRELAEKYGRASGDAGAVDTTPSVMWSAC